MIKLISKIPPVLIVFLIICIIWELFARYIAMPFIFPSISQIIAELWQQRAALFLTHLPATLKVFLFSFLLTLILGVGLGILLAEIKFLENGFFNIIVNSQTIPIIAIAPLFILWFGYGVLSKVFVATFISFPTLVIIIHNGIKSIKSDYIDLFKTMKASNWDIFIKLKIPMILPDFLNSLKIIIPIVLMGATIGEWLGGSAGLGYFSRRMMTNLNGAGIFAPVIILSSIATIGIWIVSYLEREKVFWRRK